MPGVTAVVLNPPRTHLLVVRRADDGRWTPVTGIVDPGEEPARAAEREVAEEAGIACTACTARSDASRRCVSYLTTRAGTFLTGTGA